MAERGRPKGGKKYGGRAKGTPNKTTAATKEYILEQANPVEFLIKIMRGETIPKAGGGEFVPTDDHMIDAAKTLIKKVAPDLKAVENSFKDDTVPQIIVTLRE